MDIETIAFFEKMPQAFPLYAAFDEKIRAKYPDLKIKVHKTQISFYNKHGFAYVWLPYRKVKGRPEVYLIITFGLPCRLDSPRIAEAVEPYPNRWTHHVIVEKPADIDRQLLGWIDMAYEFAWNKQRRCQL